MNVHRPEPWGVRAFRALVTLYPATFRDDYGRELTLVFVDRYRDAPGFAARMTLWFSAIAGVLREAPQEHARMIGRDIAYALRVLRKHAIVTVTIVITLGVGIGINTALFSVMNAVMFRTLPVAEPDELFWVTNNSNVSRLAEGARLSGLTFDRLVSAAPSGVPVAAMSRGVQRVHTRLDEADVSSPASLQLVSSGFFSTLGVTPVLGRAWPEVRELTAPVHPVAVISHGYWQRRFGGSAKVLGRTLTVNGNALTVIGVTPPGFTGAWLELPVDIWTPLSMQLPVRYSQDYSADDGVDSTKPWMSQNAVFWLHVIVRTSETQRASVSGAFDAALTSVSGKPVQVTLGPFGNGFSRARGQFALPLYALAGMAGLILLIACANVANLLLAKAAARQREIAVRLAMGAARGRVVHQLLVENLLIVIMAGAIALVFAQWAGDLLVRQALPTADGLPPFAAIVDLRVLAFTAAVAFGSVLIFGLIPAWRGTRVDLISALRAGARGTLGARAARPARALVMAQVAFSLVLVCGTGLMARSFRNLLAVDLGFASDRLLSVTIDPRLSGVPSDQIAALGERLLATVHGVPGVASASLAMCGIQTSCRARESGQVVEGYQPRQGEDIVFVVNGVDSTYFTTVGMRLIAGRSFDDRDRLDTTKVAVVNRALATAYFRNGDAIGRHFGGSVADIEIIGIVDDAHTINVRDVVAPAAYFPLTQRPTSPRSIEVRTAGDPSSLVGPVRRALSEAAPALPIEAIVPMSVRVGLSLSLERLLTTLTSAFGVLALALAGFGLFGVLSYAVARRIPEYGVRVALGARRAAIVRGIVADALTLVLCGLLLGLPVVLLAGNLISALFYEVSPHDWPTLTLATLTLVIVGVVSSAVPALRASRVDPIVALRED